MSEPEVNWPGTSGRNYGYWVYPIGTNLKDSPGNYIYAKANNLGTWNAVYIGQTSSLRDRLNNHEKEPCARQNGATHIHAHIGAFDEQPRMAEEKDLITIHKPVCNDQHT